MSWIDGTKSFRGRSGEAGCETRLARLYRRRWFAGAAVRSASELWLVVHSVEALPAATGREGGRRAGIGEGRSRGGCVRQIEVVAGGTMPYGC
jgi:hypothetical protein